MQSDVIVKVFRPLTEPVQQSLREEFAASFASEDVIRDPDRRLAWVRGAQALCPTVVDPVDDALLDAAGDTLRIVCNFGVGYNNIDTVAAERRGIVVTNTPDVLTESTADLAMTLMLMAARRAGEGERLCRSGRWQGWEPTQLLGTDISGQTLGLVGYGRIAAAVARRARFGFGMQIHAYTRSLIDPAECERMNLTQHDSLQSLLGASDVVSIHCPSTPDTRGMLNAESIATMPSHGILINTARGDIVDEAALAEALHSGTIAAAGLDVYAEEPVICDALYALDNVVLLPHLGSATRETRTKMGARMLANLRAFFAGRSVPDRVA